MFENKTPETIHEALMAIISDEVDKREGSVAHDLTYPVSIELGSLYMALDTVVELAFPSTAYDEYLDLWCFPFGIERKAAVPAVGQVTLSGPEGTFVPSGTRLQTSNDIFFVTTESATITNGTVTVGARGEDGGAAENVVPNEINALAPGDLYGIVTVRNSTAFTGGIDREDDEKLRARLLERARKPSTSGNVHHYKQWALEVTGVGDALVYPRHDGPGTVKVVITDMDKMPPPSNLVSATLAHINANQPVGATVTVEGATALSVNVSAALTLDEEVQVEDVKPDFEDALRDYLKSISLTGEPIRIVRVGEVLLNTKGVKDYQNLRLNNATSNILPAVNQIGVLGMVTLS